MYILLACTQQICYVTSTWSCLWGCLDVSTKGRDPRGPVVLLQFRIQVRQSLWQSCDPGNFVIQCLNFEHCVWNPRSMVELSLRGAYQCTAMTVFTDTCIARHWPRASLNIKESFVSRDIVYRISLRLFTHFITNQPTYRHMENDVIMNLKEILVRVWHGFNWLRIGSNGGLIFNTIINIRVL